MKAVTREERRVVYPPVLIFCLLAAGIFTLVIGLLALLGWIFKLPLLASFGTGLIPMAPSTAILCVLYGTAICLRARLPLSQRAFRGGVALVGLGTLVALLLFILGCLSIHLDVEHPGLNIIDVAGKAPIGHMSPVTALGFLLASLSFLASLSMSPTRPWRTGLALGAAGLLVVTGFLCLLAYVYGAPLLYGGTFLPPALNSVLIFVILGLALLALAGRTAGRSGGLPGDGSRMAFFLTLIFVLLVAGIVMVGYRYYRYYEQHFRVEAERELSAIAELKVNELAQYRKERLWDADTLFKNPALSSLVRRFLDHPEDAEAQPQIERWMAKYLATDQYDLICLFDAQGVIRLATPVEPPISSFVSQNIPEILRSNRVIFQDFTRNEHDRQVYLALLAPIYDESDGNRPLGVLALRINPETYLYPFIQRWPTPSRSGETLLVRRDGNEALFLNELRFGTNTALNQRVSMAGTNRPAVMAMLGQTGIVEGRDYRGMSVLAALSAIQDSPWFLVAKMDTAEVYAPLRERLRLTILFAGLLLISAGLGMGAIWRQQRVRHYQERYQIAEALRESEERFRRVFEEGPTGMVMLDETFRFIRVNPAFATMLGYSEAELQKMTFSDITHPDHVQQDVEQVRRLLRGELVVYRTEKRYFTKSGKELWGQVQVNVVRNADGAFRYFLAIVSDVTERKQAEEKLRRSETKFRTLYDSTSDAVMLLDENGFSDCNQATLAVYGCATREEFCSKHPADVSPPVQPDGTDSRTLANQRIATALEKGANHFEWTHKRCDTGENFIADVLLSAMELDGKPVLQAVVRDITERKRTEEALRESDERLRQAANAAGFGTYTHDFVGGASYWSPELKALLGVAPNQPLLLDADMLPTCLHPEDRAAFLAAMTAANDPHGDGLFRHEYRVIHPSGMVHWLQVRGRTSFAGEGVARHAARAAGVVLDITERRQAEEALRYEQMLTSTLMDNLPDAVYFKDAASRFLRVNRAMARRFGLSDQAQMIGKSDTNFFTREHSRQALGDEQEIVRTGKPLLNVEEKETWVDGTVSWVLTTKLPLRDGTGRIIGTCGISRDITDRKRMEEALRESRALYLSLVEQLPVGVFRKDREGRFVLVNPHFCWLKGMKVEDFLGKSPREVAAVELAKQGEMGFATKYAANGMEHHEQILRTGKPIDLVEEYAQADGSKRFLHVVKLPVLGPDGKIIGTQGIQFDITDVKQAEETIAHERQLLRTLIDRLPETFYIKDLDGHFLVANEALAKRWGKASPAQLLGLTDRDLFPAELAAEFRAEELKVFAGEPVINRESLSVFADGREHTMLTTKLPFRDSQGKICGLVGIGHDITERKQAEETLAHERQLLRTLIDLLPETFYIKDLDGRFLVVNEALARQWGKASPSQMLGLSDPDLFPAELAAQFRAEELKVFAGEPVINRESVCIYYDGRDHTTVTSKVPFRDSHGRICGLVGIGHDITERKRAEEEIARTAKEWQATFDATKDAIWILDRNSQVLRSNKTAEGFFKRTCGEMIGKPCWEVVHGTTEPIPDCPFVRARKSGHRETMDLQQGDHWFEVIVDPILDAAGQFAGAVHIVSDITERKRAELALRESEGRYRQLFELESDAIVLVDRETHRYVDVNRAAQQLYGYSREEFLQMTPEDVSTEPEKTHGHIDAADAYVPLRWHRKKNGGRFAVEINANQIIHRGRQTVLVTLRDITERKRAEESLLASEAKLLSILESTGDGILAVDRNGDKIIKTNRRYAEMWRIPQSLIDAGDNGAMRNFVLNQLSDPDAFLKRVHELYGTDAVAVDTLVFKDGRVFERHGFPMMLAGAVLGRVWSFRDITERKRQERELQEKNLELERFTYTVSHDLKSPLVTVKTFLGYLEQDLLNPDAERVKQDVGYMRGAADKMGHLLDELLNLARVGRRTNPPVRVAFQQVAQEAIGLVAGRISTSHAEVSVAGAAVILEGDRPRLVEIWQNLVENACKFMGDQPKPRVEIGVEQRGTEMVFFVRDNGAGIEPRYHEKVFSLFEKLNPKIEGTGMGLALVKRVVELYKGRIWVESGGLGQGANFLFTLPAAIIVEAETGQSS